MKTNLNKGKVVWNDYGFASIALTSEQFQQKIIELEKLGLARMPTYKNLGVELPATQYNLCAGRFCVIQKGSLLTLYIGPTYGLSKNPQIYFTRQASVEISNMNGLQAQNKMRSIFKGFEGVSIDRAFGILPDDAKFEIKNSVPTPINYPSFTNGRRNCRFANLLNKKLSNVQKADVSSAYPFQYTKTMPDANTLVVVEGEVEPSIDYPFAFYDGFGGVAIYNELDTRKYYTERKYTYYKDWGKKTTITKTYLMKASKYTMKQTMEYLYSQRKVDPEMKKVMNYFNGMNYKKSNPRYAHLSAVCIARADQFIFDKLEILEARRQLPILVNTDSIAWVGQPQPDLVSTEKKLGNFLLEYENIDAIICSCKCYQLLDNEGKTHTFWAGVSKEKTAQMEFGDIVTAPNFEIHYTWNQATYRFDKIQHDLITGLDTIIGGL